MGGSNHHDYDEIELYFSQKLAGDISAEDLVYIDALIDRDENVRRQWLDFCEGFSEQDLLTRFARLDGPRNWKDLNPQELQVKEAAGGNVRKLKGKKFAYLYAAAILIGLFISIRLLSPKKAPSTIKTLAKQEEFVLKLADGQIIDLSKLTGQHGEGITYDKAKNLLNFDGRIVKSGMANLSVPAGKSLSVQLSDGSTMIMNSYTEASFPTRFDDYNREIAIKGEVYLKIAKDPIRPFKVQAPSGAVQVLGTEFNLNSYSQAEMKVTLVSGSVKVVTAKDQLTLKPGTTAVTDGNHRIILAHSSDDHALSWKDGIYYFENSDVQEIRDVLERWYNLSIEIDHPEILNQRFTGTLDRSNDVSIFLDNLTAVTTIKYAIDSQGHVHLH